MPTDENIYIVTVPRGSSASTSDVADIEWMDALNRIAAIEGMSLEDLADVDTFGVANGMLLAYQDGEWIPISNTAGTLGRVGVNYTANEVTDVNFLTFGQGLGLSNPAAGRAHIALIMGTSVNTVAEGSHVHQLPSRLVEPIAPGAYMSGGTRPLASRSVTLPAGKSCVVTATIDMQIRGGDPGPCYFRYDLEIDGNTRTSPAGDSGYWAVQGVPNSKLWQHTRTILGTGAAITVDASVSWGSGGGGLYPDAGDLIIDVSYNR